MRNFFLVAGIVLSACGMLLIHTGGDIVAALCLGFGGSTSVLIGVFFDDIYN